jgi:hypothetical protein
MPALDSPPSGYHVIRSDPTVLKRSDIIVFIITGLAVAAAATLQFTHANDILRFAASAVALSLLAMNVSNGTEQVGN